MPNKTIGGFSDEMDIGFEKNHTVQSSVNSVKQGVKTAIKQTVKQINPVNDFVAQLYGLNTPSDEDKEIDDQGQPIQKPLQQPNAASPQAKPQPTPQQQKQNEGHKMHDQQYGGQFKLEEELKKEREKQKQQVEQKKQAEEEEIQQRAQVEQDKMQDLDAPVGKKTGMQAQRSKKASMPMRRTPVAVERARNKAEMNRGTTG